MIKREITLLKVAIPLLSLSIFLNMGTPDVWAQDAENKKAGESRKTKKAPAMSEKIYKELTKAQELIEAKEYDKGLAVLKGLEKRKLSDYEKAQLYNYFAYTYFTLEKYRDAIRAYEVVLKQPDLPEALEQNSLYTLAQLYFIVEDYKKAISIIEKWFTITDKPTENAYMLLGQGYYQLEKYKQSLVPLKKAYNMVKGRGDVPKENLLLLLRVDYFNLGDYKNMVKILRELVVYYSKTEYWLTLAGAYSELKQYKNQMSIFEMLYERGDLEQGNQQLNLANLYMMHEVPYKAAKVLEKGMKEKKIETNVKNLRLLSQAWLLAQESKNSIPPLERAARLSKDGDLDVRLAQAYINLDRYGDAVSALHTGLKKGGIKRRDQANIMLGMALFELQKFDAASNAFRDARLDKRSIKAADEWLKYIETEKNRKQQLEASLRQRRH